MNELNIQGYHRFSDNVIGKTKFFARSIHGVSNDDVRLTSRLYMPRNSLRGFNPKKLGPKDGSDWVGGNYITTLGFEAALPNLLPEALKTDVGVFIERRKYMVC